MREIDALYQEVILDHYRHPRNAGSLEHEPLHVHENPACGDAFKVKVLLEHRVVTSVVFDGAGCAISTASASMMSELIINKKQDVALNNLTLFIMTMRGELPPETLDELGEVAALGSVVRFPVRVKCATLAWHAAAEHLSRAVACGDNNECTH